MRFQLPSAEAAAPLGWTVPPPVPSVRSRGSRGALPKMCRGSRAYDVKPKHKIRRHEDRLVLSDNACILIHSQTAGTLASMIKVNEVRFA